MARRLKSSFVSQEASKYDVYHHHTQQVIMLQMFISSLSPVYFRINLRIHFVSTSDIFRKDRAKAYIDIVIKGICNTPFHHN